MRDALEMLTHRLRETPEFLAGWLADVPGGSDWMIERLSLDEHHWQQFLLCLAPRPRTFSSDVETISRYVNTEPMELARVLREAMALTALAQVDRAGSEAGLPPQTGLLAAARDEASETVSREHVSTSYIRRVAANVRNRAPASASNFVDVEAVAALAAPLATVILPGLSIQASRSWLAQRSVRLEPTDRDRRLRGLLLAWRGTGLMFIDGSLPEEDRRFTIAHELGHFLLDYLDERTRLIHRAPHLLDVVDGHRRITPSDRAMAVVEEIELGVHRHLLDREPAGAASWTVERSEGRALRFALELLTPWSAVRATARSAAVAATWPDRLAATAELLANRFGIPDDAARVRAREALDAIGRGPTFLE